MKRGYRAALAAQARQVHSPSGYQQMEIESLPALLPRERDIAVLPHNHTGTGREAARRAASRASGDRSRILQAVIALGGATREELERYTGLSGNCVRPRVWECMDKERFDPPLLKSSETTRPTKTGAPAEVLLATDAAHDYLRQVAA